MLEREIERRLINEVRRLGGRAYKWVSPGSNGVPDRIVIMPEGKIIFVELKTTTGRLTDLQKMQQRILRQLGCDIRTIYGPEQVQGFIDGLKAEIMTREDKR